MNTLLKNDLLLKALRQEKVSRPPVWMMRQAGRYLPAYQKLRDKYTFQERISTPELACEITLQPVKRLGVDAAILFSDILVIPQAMGLEVELIPNKGPFLPHPVQGEKDIECISVPDVADRLHFVFDAIKEIKRELDGEVPLVGFAGAPWTLFCYMVEGAGSKTFAKAKAFCFCHPEWAHQLLTKITESTIRYVRAQIAAGVQVIQLFDSWAGLLSKEDFEKYALPYLKRIIREIKGAVPVIVFAKGAWYSLKELGETEVDGISIDWGIAPEKARKEVGNRVTLQGNLDPSKLLAPKDQIRTEVRQMLKAFGKTGYIANLGHGILPNVPVDHARAFVDEVKSSI